MPLLSVIIPCYYNAPNIGPTTRALFSAESNLPQGTKVEYIFVDDGSGDETLQELLNVKAAGKRNVKVIKLTGNFGSHNAVLAGMEYAEGDCILLLSADLQEPPELIAQMYVAWAKGMKVVIAHRIKRPESWRKTLFANTYHRLMKRYVLPDLPDGGFDVVMFDKQVKDNLLEIKEKNTSITYLIAWMRYEYAAIPYERRAREIGKSRWTLRKRIKLFIDSFVAFSFLPVRMISLTGLALGVCALLYAAAILLFRITGYIEVEGWTTLMVVLLLVSSFQMIALGVIGEYVWRSLDASRKRPPYVVEETWL